MEALVNNSRVSHRLLLAWQLSSSADRGRRGRLRAGAEVFIVAGFIERPTGAAIGTDGDHVSPVDVDCPVGVGAVDQVTPLSRLAVGERRNDSHCHRHGRLQQLYHLFVTQTCHWVFADLEINRARADG